MIFFWGVVDVVLEGWLKGSDDGQVKCVYAHV